MDYPPALCRGSRCHEYLSKEKAVGLAQSIARATHGADGICAAMLCQ